jgi:16S rRNA (guanine527-N7)-methyltransferase
MNRDKSTPFGHFYALKGVRPDDEIAALPAGFAIEKIEPLRVPGS